VATNPAGNTLRPMRVGEVIDRALKLTIPVLITQPLRWVAIVSVVLGAISAFSSLRGELGIQLLVSVPMWVSMFLVRILTFVVGALYWHSQPVNPAEARKFMSVPLIFRLFALDVRVTLIGILIAILTPFLIFFPALIYWVNRALAGAVLVLEGQSLEGSIKRSKHLMSHHPGIPWYSFNAPMFRIGGVFLIIMIINIFPALLFMPANLGLGRELFSGALLPAIFDLIAIGFTYTVALLAQAVGHIALIGFYFDLRNRLEGADIEAGIQALHSRPAS
jgi:hypothetical protein